MKNSILQYIILYALITCVALALATLARISAVSMGFDDFTSFMVFIVILGIEAIVYLSIHVILQELMLPWIEKLLMKVPFFRDKKRTKLSINEKPESIVKQQTSPSLDDIRNEQQQNIAKEQEEKLNIALEYTRKAFASYVSDKDMELLLGNVQLYANKLDLRDLYSVKAGKVLSTIDIFHFGWNIWNHFKVGKQIDIAHFLKKVFSDILKDAEVETIKSHLKDDELKGIIKIQENFNLIIK